MQSGATQEYEAAVERKGGGVSVALTELFNFVLMRLCLLIQVRLQFSLLFMQGLNQAKSEWKT